MRSSTLPPLDANAISCAYGSPAPSGLISSTVKLRFGPANGAIAHGPTSPPPKMGYGSCGAGPNARARSVSKPWNFRFGFAAATRAALASSQPASARASMPNGAPYTSLTAPIQTWSAFAYGSAAAAASRATHRAIRLVDDGAPATQPCATSCSAPRLMFAGAWYGHSSLASGSSRWSYAHTLLNQLPAPRSTRRSAEGFV